MVKQVNFWMTGENLTRLVRDLWSSYLPKNALEILDAGGQISVSVALGILTGKMKAVGDTRKNPNLGIVEDKETHKELPKIEQVIEGLENAWLYYDYLIRKFSYEKFMAEKLSLGKKIKPVFDSSNLLFRISAILEQLNYIYPYVGKTIANLPYHKQKILLNDSDFTELRFAEYMERRVRAQAVTYIAGMIDFKNNKNMQLLPVLNKLDSSLGTVKKKKVRSAKFKVKKKLNDRNAWISPYGQVFNCQYAEHKELANHIVKNVLGFVEVKDAELELERLKWVKVSNGKCYSAGDFEYSDVQKKIIFEYMQKNELKSIECDYRKLDIEYFNFL